MKIAFSLFVVCGIVGYFSSIIHPPVHYDNVPLMIGAEHDRRQLVDQSFSVNGSHKGLTAHLKASMNDPESYQHLNTTFIDRGTFIIVTTTSLGKNAFGGTVKTTVRATTDLHGHVLTVEKLP